MKCSSTAPKEASKGQLLEAKDNLQKMLADIPVTDDDKAVADGDQAVLERLLQRLVDLPTPGWTDPTGDSTLAYSHALISAR